MLPISSLNQGSKLFLTNALIGGSLILFKHVTGRIAGVAAEILTNSTLQAAFNKEKTAPLLKRAAVAGAVLGLTTAATGIVTELASGTASAETAVQELAAVALATATIAGIRRSKIPTAALGVTATVLTIVGIALMGEKQGTTGALLGGAACSISATLGASLIGRALPLAAQDSPVASLEEEVAAALTGWTVGIGASKTGTVQALIPSSIPVKSSLSGYGLSAGFNPAALPGFLGRTLIQLAAASRQSLAHELAGIGILGGLWTGTRALFCRG